MKFVKYLLLPLAVTFINAAQADNAPYPKPINIPFSHERIFKHHYYTGLIFNYDLNGTPRKKVICKLSSVVKGWLDFTDNGNVDMTSAYGDGGSVTLTLTNIDRTMDTRYHVDAVGSITVNSVDRIPGTLATASCHYEYDE